MAVRQIPRFAGKLGVVITVRDAAEAAAFYGRAFGAEERARRIVPDHPPSVGPVKGVTIQIREAVVELSTANPRKAGNMDPRHPRVWVGSGTVLRLYVDDPDSAAARAVAAGARMHGAVEDTPTGDRVALLEDPFGHPWALVAVREEISVGEHNRRWEQLSGPTPRLALPS